MLSSVTWAKVSLHDILLRWQCNNNKAITCCFFYSPSQKRQLWKFQLLVPWNAANSKDAFLETSTFLGLI